MRILIVTGEASGDAHAAKVVPHLAAAGYRVDAVGGPALLAAGADVIEPLDALSVIGLVEVIARLPRLAALQSRLVAGLRARRWDLVLTVDYPGFNLRLARRAHRYGIPVVHYIGPQVWAWRAHRLALLRRAVAHVALVLPFEKPLYDAAGVPATWVGHPLLDDPEPAAVAVDRDLGLFPGSRAQEIDRHLEVLVAAAAALRRRRRDLRLLVSRAPTVDAARFAPVLRAYGFDPECMTCEPARVALRRCRAALVKSGTTTLEAALAERPFAVLYRTSGLTFAVARRLVRVPFASLVNLVAGAAVVREYLQAAATPAALAAEAERLLDDDSERARIAAAGRGVRARLGTPGASARVAALVTRVAPSPRSAA
jgi:lipid-A-disaccharide synthase